MRATVLTMALLASLGALPLHAQQAGATQALPADGIRTEAAVVVEGEQPGPGLWIVRKGGHDLYVLGMLSPLPTKMQWRAQQVQQVLAGAQEVIRAPSVSLDVKAGFFSQLLLLPQMLGARNNPDGKYLRDVVSPASYARWQALKVRYPGVDGGAEKMRPLFAAQEMYGEAMKRAGLNGQNIVTPVINAAIKAHQLRVTEVKETVVVTDPKSLLREWKKTTLDDLACFDNTMTRLETDIDAMRARANAWASGDVAALRSLPPAYQWEACNSAFTEAGIGKRLGFGDARQKVRAKWLEAAEAALERNSVSFAMLSLNDMLGTNGYLAALQAKGYTVIGPDE